MPNHKYGIGLVACLILARVLMADPVETSRGEVFADPGGDAKGVDESNGFMDFTGLQVYGKGDQTLLFNVETRDPIPDKPTRHRSWIGLYLDLDKDPDTGLSVKGIGADVVLALESRNGKDGYEWIVNVETVSVVGRKYEFTPKLILRNGNRLIMQLHSPDAFQYYPQFNVQGYTHEEGTWCDYLEAISVTPLVLFPVTDKAINFTETLNIELLLDPRPGRIQKMPLNVNRPVEEIRCTVDVRKAPRHERWMSTFQINLDDQQGDKILDLRISASAEEHTVMIGGVRTRPGKSWELTTLTNSPNPRFLGKHELVLRFLSNDRIRCDVDGVDLGEYPLRSTVRRVEMVSVGTVARAELAIR
ncbi:hypothetical protein [Puniceicoccus vermicola]|uniref:Uncharacterized protein n=1 Tax=Puniceicoccus vermicola TaxID=388746 RepID=A0A7X1E550_9BACT|nr:hypothetical protein [Puniceicoccus vermicola]MBC2602764.1 hypothetical protein [Puniceicoccus vermicola]